MDYLQALVYDSDPDAQGIDDELQPEQHYNGTVGNKLMYNRRYVMQSEGLLRAVDASRYNHLLVNAAVTFNDILGSVDATTHTTVTTAATAIPIDTSDLLDDEPTQMIVTA